MQGKIGLNLFIYYLFDLVVVGGWPQSTVLRHLIFVQGLDSNFGIK